MPKRDAGFVDLTGRQFGSIIVLGFAGRCENSHKLWNISCSLCGNSKIIREFGLSKRTSCGCDAGVKIGASNREALRKKGYSAHVMDDGSTALTKHSLLGKRFGRLVVVGISGGVKHAWLCVCDCGRKRAILGANLLSGSSKSCGCIFRDFLGEVQNNLEAQLKTEGFTQKVKIPLDGCRFGRLTVVSYARSLRTPSGTLKSFWRCLCDCGATILVYRSNLVNGMTRSCGCLYQERAESTHS